MTVKRVICPSDKRVPSECSAYDAQRSERDCVRSSAGLGALVGPRSPHQPRGAGHHQRAGHRGQLPRHRRGVLLLQAAQCYQSVHRVAGGSRLTGGACGAPVLSHVGGFQGKTLFSTTIFLVNGIGRN